MERLRKSWLYKLRPEHAIFLVVLAGTAIIYFFFYIFLRDVFPDFITKFLAGFLGVLIGFALDRQIEFWKRVRANKQIINSFLTELKRNHTFCQKYKGRVVAPAPGNPLREDFFDLFQISTWDMYCSRLEMEDINVQYKLGELYHRLQLFNSATMNNNETQRALAILLGGTPKYLYDLEQELDNLVKSLENELKKLP